MRPVKEPGCFDAITASMGNAYDNFVGWAREKKAALNRYNEPHIKDELEQETDYDNSLLTNYRPDTPRGMRTPY